MQTLERSFRSEWLLACRVTAAALLLVATPVPAFGEDRSVPRFREALSLWIEGREAGALDVVLKGVLPPEARPGACRGENGDLWNLGARVLDESYRRDGPIKSDEAKRQLRRAENFAAAAVWECPQEPQYWRDYVRIAVEQRLVRGTSARVSKREQAIEKLRSDILVRDLRYPDVARGFELTADDELRHVAHAFIREVQDDAHDAQRILQSWIAEPEGRARCAAAAILVELQLEADDFAGASEFLNGWHDCSGAAAQVLKARRELLREKSTDGSDPIVLTSYDASPHVSAGIDVSAYPDFSQVANRILRDPSGNEDWDDLRSAAGTDIERLRGYDLLLDRMSESWRGTPASAVMRARAFRFIREGKFRKARRVLDKLIQTEAGRYDAETAIASVLIDTDEDMERSGASNDRLNRARELDPHMSACVDTTAIQYCLDRREECTLGAILCRDAHEALYKVWSRGWKRRPSSVIQLAKTVEELKKRVELNQELMEQIEPRIMVMFASEQKAVEQRFAEYERRIDFIENVGLRALREELKAIRQINEARYEELREQIAQQRAKQRADILRLEQDYLADRDLIESVVRELSVSRAEASRLLRQLATDVALLKASRPELSSLLEGQWGYLQAQLKELRTAIAELRQPDLVRYVETLMNPGKASPEEMLNALAYVLDELVQIAMPGKLIVRAIPILKGLSDFLVDRYEKRKGRCGSAIC